MKKLSALFIALCVMLTMLTGCNKYKDIEITGGKIESISMTGLRSVNLGLAVGIDNPRGKIEIRHVDGVVMHFGKVIGRVTLDPFVVEKKSAGDYHLEAVFALDENMGLRQIMQFVNIDKLYECTVDIHVKAYSAGVSVQKRFRNVPMKELFEL